MKLFSDHNAATRYYYAISWLDTANYKSQEFQISQFSKGLVPYDQLSSEAKITLNNWQVSRAVSALVLGAKQAKCHFFPDSLNYNSEAFPSIGKIRTLQSASHAIATKMIQSGQQKAPIEILVSCVILGRHLTQYAGALEFISGFAIARDSLKCLKTHLGQFPKQRKFVKNLLSKIPSPLLDAKRSLIFEVNNLKITYNLLDSFANRNNKLRCLIRRTYSPEKAPHAISKIQRWVAGNSYNSDKRKSFQILRKAIRYKYEESNYIIFFEEVKKWFEILNEISGYGAIWSEILKVYEMQNEIEKLTESL